MLFVFPIPVLGSFYHEAMFGAENAFLFAFINEHEHPLELVMVNLIPPRPVQAVAAVLNANDIEEIKQDH